MGNAILRFRRYKSRLACNRAKILCQRFLVLHMESSVGMVTPFVKVAKRWVRSVVAS